MNNTLHREEKKTDQLFSDFASEHKQTSPWTTPVFSSQTTADGPTTTTRFAQLLLNPLTGQVTATEVEQKINPGFLFDDDWCLEKDEAAASPRKKYGDVVIPSFEFSSCSSSSCSSISSCTMSEQSEEDIWEELVDTYDAGEELFFPPPPTSDPMPFVLSSLPLSSDSFDDASWMGNYLLSDDVEAIYAGDQKKRGCIKTLHLVRWKSLYLTMMEEIQEEGALLDALWYILCKGRIVRCYGLMNKCTSYESF